ncbi:MAG: response regulator [Bacteroidales bacterium]|nr:response regulator [Bacteroidales bacterium]
MDRFNPVDILLIEDNATDAELTMRAFRKHNLANRVFAVETGEDAIDYVFSKGAFAERAELKLPKVVLLDLRLPRMSGMEVLEMLKSDPRTKSIPVIIITQSKEDPDIRSAYELGASGYVTKPVDFNSFINSMCNSGLFLMVVDQNSE